MSRHDPERRERIVRFLADYWFTYGHGPSVAEIAEAVGLTSTSVASHHLLTLWKQGRVSASYGPRRNGSPMRIIARSWRPAPGEPEGKSLVKPGVTWKTYFEGFER